MEKQSRLKELGDFLKTRRKRLSPSDYGISIDSRRRTTGLRREEIAIFSNISVTLYTWLEQGRDINVSNDVLESLCKTFKLSSSERNHLFMLAQMQSPPPIPFKIENIDPSYQLILDNFKDLPAYILDNYWNIIAWNDAACDIFGDFPKMSNENRNTIWRVFTDKNYRKLFYNWEEVAKKLLSMFRASSVYFLDQEWYDSFLQRIKEESPEFKKWWSEHDVKATVSDLKIINHPSLGKLCFKHNTFSINDYPNFTLTIYIPCNSDNKKPPDFR